MRRERMDIQIVDSDYHMWVSEFLRVTITRNTVGMIKNI